MKSLHVISSGGMYGAEAVVLNLLRELRDSPSPAALAVFRNRGNPHLELHHAALAAGMESYTLPCSGQVDPSAVAELRRLAHRTGAEIVHAHGYKADVYTAFAARRSPWRMVSTCHNWCDTDLATRLYGRLDRLSLRRARAVVAVSAEVRQKLIGSGLAGARVALIRNGIDPAAFAPVAAARQLFSGPATVGFAGRLSSEKGADLFLEAARLLLASRPGTRFVLAGDGPERPALEAACAAHGVQQSVMLLGRQEDMPAFYRSVDLLLSPSRTEGLPIGLMEAMAAGLPVVATAVGDVPTLVEDGVTGLLVPAGDPAALARAALPLLDEPGRALAMGAAGARRIAEHFSARAMAAEYLALYREVLRPGA